MNRFTTYSERDALLKMAIGLPGGSSIKDIAAAISVKANTLYKWKTTSAHLSCTKADALLLYCLEHEPQRLELAEAITSIYL